MANESTPFVPFKPKKIEAVKPVDIEVKAAPTPPVMPPDPEAPKPAPVAVKPVKAAKKAEKAEAKVENSEVKAEAKAEKAEAKAAKAGAREEKLPHDGELTGAMQMGDLLAALSDRYPQYDIVPIRWMMVKVPGGAILVDFADVNDFGTTAELRAYINALPIREGNKPNG